MIVSGFSLFSKYGAPALVQCKILQWKSMIKANQLTFLLAPPDRVVKEQQNDEVRIRFFKGSMRK